LLLYVIKRYIRVEEVAQEYGFSVEENEYIATDLYKLYNTNIHEKIAEAKKRDNQRKISVD
jgi:hypothetical protein